MRLTSALAVREFGRYKDAQREGAAWAAREFVAPVRANPRYLAEEFDPVEAADAFSISSTFDTHQPFNPVPDPVTFRHTPRKPVTPKQVQKILADEKAKPWRDKAADNLRARNIEKKQAQVAEMAHTGDFIVRLEIKSSWFYPPVLIFGPDQICKHAKRPCLWMLGKTLDECIETLAREKVSGFFRIIDWKT